MIGKIIGAVLGERAAKQSGDMSGPSGALLGAGAAAAIRRLGPLGLIAAMIGGFFLKRHLEKPDARRATRVPR